MGAVTGYLSPQMEAKYARRANQKKNAKAAIIQWSAGRKNKA